MDISWGKFVALAISSGAAAGLANQLFRFAHDWIAESRLKKSQERDRAHQLAMQEGEREHQASLRREAAFAAAKEPLLPLATALAAWIAFSWGDVIRDDLDYAPPALAQGTPVQDGSEADQVLRTIAALHPSKRVRLFAESLRALIDNTMNLATFQGSGVLGKVTSADYDRWEKMGHELIEAMHDPDYIPVDPGLP